MLVAPLSTMISTCNNDIIPKVCIYIYEVHYSGNPCIISGNTCSKQTTLNTVTHSGADGMSHTHKRARVLIFTKAWIINENFPCYHGYCIADSIISTCLEVIYHVIVFASVASSYQGHRLRRHYTACKLRINCFFIYSNPGQPRTLLQLKLVAILTINVFLT
jgi:hypothetical protein